MQFIDTARFALNNCVHSSNHLQCLLSSFIWGGGFTYCPIMDTPQCKWEGEAHYWAPEDYFNFARAALRTKSLSQIFLKPEYGGKFFIQPSEAVKNIMEEENKGYDLKLQYEASTRKNIQVHYLVPIQPQGPDDGLNPSTVAVPFQSV